MMTNGKCILESVLSARLRQATNQQTFTGWTASIWTDDRSKDLQPYPKKTVHTPSKVTLVTVRYGNC